MEGDTVDFQNRNHQAHVDSLETSIKHLKEKLYQCSIISSRGENQMNYFITHSVEPALPQYQKQTKTDNTRKKKQKLQAIYHQVEFIPGMHSWCNVQK